jgi:two-component system osmolarity sensor histidine kinase EnvZ
MIKKFLPRGLFARSLLILIVPLLLVQIITTTVFFDNHWRKITARLVSSLAGDVALITQYDIDPNTIKQNLDMNIQVIDEGFIPRDIKYETFYFWENYAVKEFQKELNKRIDIPFEIQTDFENKVIYLWVSRPNDTLYLTIPERRLYSPSGYILILWMMGTSVLMLLIAIIFMRNQIRPIRRLAIAAERFGKGGDTPGFKPAGAREVRRAAQAFIDMRERIKRQIEQRTMMLAGVSHDLRTPLTRLKLQLEMMDDTAETQDMRRDVQDMTRMIDGYLDFARGATNEPASFTNIGNLIHQTLDRHANKSLDIEKSLAKDVNAMVRPLSIQRCLDNLINNADKFSTKTLITLKEKDNQAIITVEDNGPGLPSNEREDVFKPFYRVDSSRHEPEGHAGLGLSIAQDIIHTHGGDIHLGKSDLGGLKVTLSLPV